MALRLRCERQVERKLQHATRSRRPRVQAVLTSMCVACALALCLFAGTSAGAEGESNAARAEQAMAAGHYAMAGVAYLAAFEETNDTVHLKNAGLAFLAVGTKVALKEAESLFERYARLAETLEEAQEAADLLARARSEAQNQAEPTTATNAGETALVPSGPSARPVDSPSPGPPAATDDSAARPALAVPSAATAAPTETDAHEPSSPESIGGLTLSGALTFGFFYASTAIVGALMLGACSWPEAPSSPSEPDPAGSHCAQGDAAPMFIPVAGPVITAFLVDADEDAQGVTWRGLLVNLAVGQTAGALMLISGLTSSDPPRSSSVAVQPVVSPSISGLVLSGVF